MRQKRKKRKNNKIENGIIVKKLRDFGFIQSDQGDPSQGDFFVSDKNMKGAMLGDRVSFKLSAGRRGNLEAKVVKILKRSPGDFVGMVHKDRNLDYAMSINPDSNDAVLINKEGRGDLSLGDLVALKIEDYGSAKLLPYGRISKHFGHIESMRALSEAILYDEQIYLDFPADVEAEAEKIDGRVRKSDIDKRKDLRKLLTVTIDGRDAKDFDDAISFEKLERGYRLYVHIADVAHFVRKDSKLDREALRRGNSVYVPGMVSPMLPEQLSNQACSLKPNEDRLCLSCAIDLDFKGNIKHTELYESVVRSDYRLCYEDVDEWLGQDKKKRKQVGWGRLNSPT